MRCKQAQKLSTEYLDGNLSDEASSAVRGHLRTCDACRELVAQEATVREVAESLPDLDPPAALWHRIQDELAEHEVSDSERPLALLQIRERVLSAWPHALGAAALVVVVVLLTRPSQHSVATALQPSQLDRVAETPDTQPIALPARTLEQAREAELARAEARYQSVIEELLAAVDERREELTPTEERELEQRMTVFRAEVAKLRRRGGSLALAPSLDDERTVFAVYRQHIDYLSEVAVGGQL